MKAGRPCSVLNAGQQAAWSCVPGHYCRLASCADSCVAVARTIVCMERSYVTAAFFRHRTYERYRALQQQQAARLLGEGAPTLHGATRWHVIP